MSRPSRSLAISEAERISANALELVTRVKSLLLTIEAMRCECPSRDVRESGGEDDQTHWFGGFGQGHFDYEDVETFYVQWPNLGILAEQLQELLKGHEKVNVGRPLDQ